MAVKRNRSDSKKYWMKYRSSSIQTGRSHFDIIDKDNNKTVGSLTLVTAISIDESKRMGSHGKIKVVNPQIHFPKYIYLENTAKSIIYKED